MRVWDPGHLTREVPVHHSGYPCPHFLLDVSTSLFVRQFIVRHLVRVINTTDDERTIRIAFQKVNYHFLSDSRDSHEAPLSASDTLRGPNPAGTLVILLAFAIPMELDFDTAIFVCMNLFAFGAHHDGSLNAGHDRFRGFSGWSKQNILRDAGERIRVILPGISRTGLIRQRLSGGVSNRGDQKRFSLDCWRMMFGHLKNAAREKCLAATGNVSHFKASFGLLNTNFCLGTAFGLLSILPGVIVDFEFAAVGKFCRMSTSGNSHQGCRWSLEVVIGMSPAAAVKLKSMLPTGDMVIDRRGPEAFGVVDGRFRAVTVGGDIVSQNEDVTIF